MRWTLRIEPPKLAGACFSLQLLAATSVKGENREETVAVQQAPRRILVAQNVDVVFIIAIIRTGGNRGGKQRII